MMKRDALQEFQIDLFYPDCSISGLYPCVWSLSTLDSVTSTLEVGRIQCRML